MLNFKIIFRVLGFLLVVEGVSMLIAMGVSAIYQDAGLMALLNSALICLGVGSLTLLATKGADKKIGKHEGFVIVSLVWVVFSFFGSLPYLFSHSIPSLSNAFLETMSGFTTTGWSILNDID